MNSSSRLHNSYGRSIHLTRVTLQPSPRRRVFNWNEHYRDPQTLERLKSSAHDWNATIGQIFYKYLCNVDVKLKAPHSIGPSRKGNRMVSICMQQQLLEYSWLVGSELRTAPVSTQSTDYTYINTLDCWLGAWGHLFPPRVNTDTEQYVSMETKSINNKFLKNYVLFT